MTLTPEQQAERDRVMAEIDAILDAGMPKPKPKPKLVSTNSLSLETDKARLFREQRRVIEREKASLRRANEQNQAIIRERQALVLIDHRTKHEKVVQAWEQSIQDMDAHKRWLRRNFDASIYWPEPYHRDGNKT
jgi:hypothetical protein